MALLSHFTRLSSSAYLLLFFSAIQIGSIRFAYRKGAVIYTHLCVVLQHKRVFDHIEHLMLKTYLNSHQSS